jgi:hypothetical protein
LQVGVVVVVVIVADVAVVCVAVADVSVAVVAVEVVVCVEVVTSLVGDEHEPHSTGHSNLVDVLPQVLDLPLQTIGSCLPLHVIIVQSKHVNGQLFANLDSQKAPDPVALINETQPSLSVTFTPLQYSFMVVVGSVMVVTVSVVVVVSVAVVNVIVVDDVEAVVTVGAPASKAVLIICVSVPVVAMVVVLTKSVGFMRVVRTEAIIVGAVVEFVLVARFVADVIVAEAIVANVMVFTPAVDSA